MDGMPGDEANVQGPLGVAVAVRVRYCQSPSFRPSENILEMRRRGREK
jgi:hypothetical protein